MAEDEKMNACVRLNRNDGVRTFGIRATAEPYRQQVEEALQEAGSVTIDFGGYEATQSFVDQLIGSLMLRHGREVLSKLVFENCSPEVKGIIRFVVKDRAGQLASSAAA
ncbi:STAS-like domain-containing protein [Pseudomonas aeruginosa]|uniref:STAS-like domain-containing protein n=1 Tax=Pseudomonas aeruginosa TaxID=287 RepID=UPI001419E363|nr:STAS-like domain-containing protein [Pseudomonas aeruginosa]EKQ5877261.1 STAS-like domain-containing protein [Pseudomonas aeruginosa]ELC8327450.1 STAS-like domain-containing protein [Pseudomonas aeruginosa]ELX9492993.1 STAS-like domain-containing protein [Pseudomonas aeruginosa]MBG4629077.1 STAS-like domain-containing protein [Pseudomonas aeruginosa]MBG6338820.1 STAS-like domain-containing protein [Pseudomonas aeruginosa]